MTTGLWHADAPPSWRLRYIDLHVTLDPIDKSVRGVSRLTVAATAVTADPLVVDVSDSLTVDSAVAVGPGGTRTVGVRGAARVTFTPAAHGAGATYVASVWYHGRPVRRIVGFADHAGVPRAASFGIPLAAREWWPSMDSPSQKADSADLWFTAPARLLVASNGRLVGRDLSTDHESATSHWSVRHPIYADIVSFSLADFAVTRQTVTLASGARLPIEFYVFPEDSAKAAATFAHVPRILAFLEDRLGAYPFANEKYALVEFARPSFREGQTLSNLGPNLITGLTDNDQVLAHEMAHQWFGNSLTARDWSDIWLNESLAELMAWDWIHRSQGDSAYTVITAQAQAATAPAPIAPASASDPRTLFGVGTFVKGPLVLTQLRDLIGEQAFTGGLRAYVARHAYGLVSTIDLQRAFEQASGRSLQAFFDQRIFGR